MNAQASPPTKKNVGVSSRQSSADQKLAPREQAKSLNFGSLLPYSYTGFKKFRLSSPTWIKSGHFQMKSVGGGAWLPSPARIDKRSKVILFSPVVTSHIPVQVDQCLTCGVVGPCIPELTSLSRCVRKMTHAPAAACYAKLVIKRMKTHMNNESHQESSCDRVWKSRDYNTSILVLRIL